MKGAESSMPLLYINVINSSKNVSHRNQGVYITEQLPGITVIYKCKVYLSQNSY